MAAKVSTKIFSELVSRRGFTLIEMLVVLVVLGMISTVVLPRVVAMMDGQSDRDFRSSLMRLGAEARLLAIESGSTVQISYNDSDRSVQISILDIETANEQLETSYLLPDDVEFVTFMVGADMVSAGDWIVEYYADGTGTDCGLEVQSGGSFYALLIEGEDGASYSMDSLEEVSDSEWEAGELEQRLQ